MAGRRADTPTFLVRPRPPVRGRTAPRGRPRCADRKCRRGTCCGSRLLRRHRPDGREDRFDPDVFGLHVDPRAPRFHLRHARRDAWRGGSGRIRGAERRGRALRPLRLLRRANDERPAGIRRSDGFAPDPCDAATARGRDPCKGGGRRSGDFGTGRGHPSCRGARPSSRSRDACERLGRRPGCGCAGIGAGDPCRGARCARARTGFGPSGSASSSGHESEVGPRCRQGLGDACRLERALHVGTRPGSQAREHPAVGNRLVSRCSPRRAASLMGARLGTRRHVPTRLARSGRRSRLDSCDPVGVRVALRIAPKPGSYHVPPRIGARRWQRHSRNGRSW